MYIGKRVKYAGQFWTVVFISDLGVTLQSGNDTTTIYPAD